jgi:hypothetical protein
MSEITITKFITVEAWKFNGKEDVARLVELTPGQVVRVAEQDGDCFRLRQGWVELPGDAWR